MCFITRKSPERASEFVAFMRPCQVKGSWSITQATISGLHGTSATEIRILKHILCTWPGLIWYLTVELNIWHTIRMYCTCKNASPPPSPSLPVRLCSLRLTPVKQMKHLYPTDANDFASYWSTYPGSEGRKLLALESPTRSTVAPACHFTVSTQVSYNTVLGAERSTILPHTR
jgi:hypothetical protein